jgi:hypothetical protein
MEQENCCPIIELTKNHRVSCIGKTYKQNMPMFCGSKTVSVGSQISIISYLPYGYENLFRNFLTTEKKKLWKITKVKAAIFVVIKP